MISILMPIYNGAEYLRESLPSVVGQTFEQWELLIGVNGYPAGSTVYRKVALYDSRKIRVFDLPDVKGKSQALNALVDKASFPFMCLLDVDDIWEVTKLEKQFPYMGSYGVVGTNARYFGERQDDPGIPTMEVGFEVFRRQNPIVNSSAMFRKTDAHWGDIKGVEDYDMWCRLAAAGRTFFNIPEMLVQHRVHKDSAFNTAAYDASIADIRRRHGFI